MRDRARAAVVLFAVAAAVVSCAGLVDLEHVTYGDGDGAGTPAEGGSSGGDAAEAATDAQSVPVDVDVPKDGAATVDAGTCGVRADKRLYCTNRANAPLYAQPNKSAEIVNTIRTTSSYFLCWGTGEPHAGGNSTWYYTIGDDNPNLGWTPGVMLNTPDAFDANPRAFGLRNCAD
jgi:hypothetical protein